MIGERIGNFRISSLLGRGGMGEVFLGEHEKIGTKVALKMLLPHISANKDHVERFFNEAIAVSKVQHSGIGKIFDVGFHGERAYLVMEFLAGETLAARIRRLGKLPLAMVGDLGKQIAGVLEAVHKAGVTHRDLKPDNIFIVPDDELPTGERVKIVDFGIAKLSGATNGLTATGTGSMGTPAYMSPEQWKNSKTVDWRADAYSLGCVAFEMTAGRPPFLAETLGEACSMHLTEEPPRLTSIVAAPAHLDGLVAQLLAKSPDQRPATMREIATAFGAIGEAGAAAAIAIGATMPSQPPVARHQATQVTGVPQAAHAPAPQIHQTTLGGSGSGQVVPAAPPKRRSALPWIAAGGVAVAAIIVVAIVLSRRDQVEVKAALEITDTPAGSNVVASTTPGTPQPKPEPPGPTPEPTPEPSPEPKLGERPRRRLEGRVGPTVNAPPDNAVASGSIDVRANVNASIYLGTRKIGTAPVKVSVSPGKYTLLAVTPHETLSRDIVVVAGKLERHEFAFENLADPLAGSSDEALPKHTPTRAALQPLYPKFNKCGADHGATGTVVEWLLTVDPDGRFKRVMFVDQGRSTPTTALSPALVKCLTAVFASAPYGRARLETVARDSIKLR